MSNNNKTSRLLCPVNLKPACLGVTFLVILTLFGCCPKSKLDLLPDINRPLSNKEQLPDFSAYKITKEKKVAFFAFLAPMVQAENEHILAIRSALTELSVNGFDDDQREWLLALAQHYELDDAELNQPEDETFWKLLFQRIDVVPASMVLAQAANESAWGTSRFAVQGNNLFGQWCYKKGCGLVPKQRNTGTFHEVAKFSSPAASVSSYMRNINTHPAYKQLRQMRAELRTRDQKIDGPILVKGLTKYSTRGEEYVKEISTMIKTNGLVKFDGQ